MVGATLYRIVPSKADFPDRKTKEKEKQKKEDTRNRIMAKERIGKEDSVFKSLLWIERFISRRTGIP